MLTHAYKTWQATVDDYLAERRRAGFALSVEAIQLACSARFAQCDASREPLTVDLACRWAFANRTGERLTAARCIEVLRGFARYCQQFDPATQMPPRHLFGPAHRRLTPHIYTDEEIRALIEAA